jgi:hypothetical protein
MKSRLTVSLLFILIGATFTSDATAGLEKLRSWTGKVCSRCAAQVYNRLSFRDSALTSAIKRNDKDEVTMNHLDGDRLLLQQNCVGFIRTAARQIHRMLGLMRII